MVEHLHTEAKHYIFSVSLSQTIEKDSFKFYDKLQAHEDNPRAKKLMKEMQDTATAAS